MVELTYVNQYDGEAVELITKCIFIPYIGAVDIPSNSFSMRVDLDFEWKATDADKASFEANAAEYRPELVPQLVFQNAREVEQTEVAGSNGNAFKITDAGFNYLRLKVVGTFIEQYELQAFPVDVQQLSVSISVSFLSAKQLKFVPPVQPDGKPFTFAYLLGRYSALPDWTLERVMTEFSIKDEFSHLLVVTQVRRIPNALMHKGVLPAFLYSYAAFVNIVLDPIDNVNDRMGVLFTLLLTFTALQHLVMAHTPLVPYLTLYDRYTNMCFACLWGFLLVALGMGLAAHPTVGFTDEASLLTVRKADFWLHIHLVGLLTVVQLYFYWTYRTTAAQERKKLTMTWKQLREYEQAQSGAEDLILTQNTDQLLEDDDTRDPKGNASETLLNSSPSPKNNEVAASP